MNIWTVLKSVLKIKFNFKILKDEHISEEEHLYAVKVWYEFKMKSWGDYNHLYLTIDVLLLIDVFGKFINW